MGVRQVLDRSVLVIERDRVVARQVHACLTFAGFSVLGPAPTVREGLALLNEHPVDAIVTDLTVTDGDRGLEDVSTTASARKIPTVYLSSRADLSAVQQAASANAAAFVLKPFADRQLVSTVLLAVMTVERAEADAAAVPVLTSEEKLRAIAALLNDTATEGARVRPGSLSGAPEPLDTLSAREREVVDLLANGARVVTIAQHLSLSPHTVRNHLKSVFRKLNLRGQHELFEYWRARAW